MLQPLAEWSWSGSIHRAALAPKKNKSPLREIFVWRGRYLTRIVIRSRIDTFSSNSR